MNKPGMKTRIAITKIIPDHGLIVVTTDPETVDELKEFGHVSAQVGNSYNFFVDARYDFAEVVEYIKSLNETPKTEE